MQTTSTASFGRKWRTVLRSSRWHSCTLTTQIISNSQTRSRTRGQSLRQGWRQNHSRGPWTAWSKSDLTSRQDCLTQLLLGGPALSSSRRTALLFLAAQKSKTSLTRPNGSLARYAPQLRMLDQTRPTAKRFGFSKRLQKWVRARTSVSRPWCSKSLTW